MTGITYRLVLLLSTSLVLGACSEEGPTPSLDSETHWLKQCAESGDCGGGLECLCGLCTLPCDEADDCTVVAPTATCIELTSLADECDTPPSDSTGICGLSCQGDSDCQTGASGTLCVNGTCLPPESPEPDFVDVGSDELSAGCPVAVPRVRVQGSDTAWQTEIETAPVTTVELDGSLSSAAGGIATYSWQITERPEGSVAAIEPDSSPETAKTLLDLTGRYVFDLTVLDHDDAPSCVPASAVATVRPGDGIHVEMIRPTVGESSSDTAAPPMEIHFLNTLGSWTSDPWDCTVGNAHPEWGDTHSEADNPSLFVVDLEELVPSVIVLKDPEDAEYKLGVLCRTSTETGACQATFRVFLDGVVSTLSSPEGFETGQFWDALDIDWEQREANNFNRIYENGIPGTE